jgi:putative membrane protein
MITALAIPAVHGAAYWGPGFGWLFLLIPLFWIALFVILFAVFGRRWRRAAMHSGYGPYGRMNPTRQAEATLAERYAQGDIDEVEYRKRLEVLRANAPVPPER